MKSNSISVLLAGIAFAAASFQTAGARNRRWPS